MPNINIDDAYILNETGAQVDKVTGLFTKDEETTSGEKAFAQLNIGTAGSNRNLLDNPWFTVNQKGVTTWRAESYGVDRWYAQQGEATVSGSNVTLPPLSYIRQRFDRADFIGRTFTMSFLDADGNIGFATIPNVADETYNVKRISGFDFSIDTRTGVAGAGLVKLVYYNTSGTSSRTLKAVKLETGAFSTLANDFPPDYGEELAKCQRYFLRLKSSSQALPLGFGVQSSSTAVRLLIPTPVEMRAQPTVSFSGTHRIFGGDATSKTVSSYSVVDRTSSGIGLVANISSGTFAENKAYILYVASGGYLDLSADL